MDSMKKELLSLLLESCDFEKYIIEIRYIKVYEIIDFMKRVKN